MKFEMKANMHLAPKGQNMINPVQAKRSSGTERPPLRHRPVGATQCSWNVAPLRGAGVWERTYTPSCTAYGGLHRVNHMSLLRSENSTENNTTTQIQKFIETQSSRTESAGF